MIWGQVIATYQTKVLYFNAKKEHTHTHNKQNKDTNLFSLSLWVISVTFWAFFHQYMALDWFYIPLAIYFCKL